MSTTINLQSNVVCGKCKKQLISNPWHDTSHKTFTAEVYITIQVEPCLSCVMALNLELAKKIIRDGET